MTSGRSMEFEIRVRDAGLRVLKEMEQSVKRLAAETQKLSKEGVGAQSFLTGAALGGVAGAVASSALNIVSGAISQIKNMVSEASQWIQQTIVESVTLGGHFEVSMQQIAALSTDARQNLGELTEQVKETSLAFGTDLFDTQQAMFNVVAAIGEAKDADLILAEAAKLAAVGQSSLAEASDAMVRTLNAYGMSARQAGEAADKLFAAQQEGILTVGQLAQNIGMVVPAAAAAGVSLDELAASIATATKVIQPDIAITALRNLFIAISAATDKVAEKSREMAREVGNSTFEFSQAGLQALGFTEFLNQMVDVLGNDAQKMHELGIESRTLGVAFELVKNDAQEFRKQMLNVAASPGIISREFAAMSKTTGFHMRQVATEFQILRVKLYEELQEPIGKLMRWLLERMDIFKASVKVMVTGITLFLSSALVTFGPLVRFLIMSFGSLVQATLKLGEALEKLGIVSKDTVNFIETMRNGIIHLNQAILEQEIAAGERMPLAITEWLNALAELKGAQIREIKDGKEETKKNEDMARSMRDAADAIREMNDARREAAVGVAARFKEDEGRTLTEEQAATMKKQLEESYREIIAAIPVLEHEILLRKKHAWLTEEQEQSLRFHQERATLEAQYVNLRAVVGNNEELLAQIEVNYAKDLELLRQRQYVSRIQQTQDFAHKMSDIHAENERALLGVEQGGTAQQVAEIKRRYALMLNTANVSIFEWGRIFQEMNRAIAAVQGQQTKQMLEEAKAAERALLGVQQGSTVEQLAEVQDRYERLKKEAKDNAEAIVEIERWKNAEIKRITLEESMKPKNLGEGFVTEIARMNEEASNQAKIGATLAQSIHGGMSDMFSSIVTKSKTASQAMKDFAKSILATLAEMAAKLLTSKILQLIISGLFGVPLQSGTSGTSPTSMGQAQGVSYFSEGGVVTRPTRAVVGEAGPEAVIPLKGGAVPIREVGGRGSKLAPVVVNFNVSAVDAYSFKRLLTSEQDVLANIIADAMQRKNNIRSAVRSAARGG